MKGNRKDRFDYPWYLTGWFITAMIIGGVITLGFTTLLGIFLLPVRKKYKSFSEGALEKEAFETLKFEKESLLTEKKSLLTDVAASKEELQKIKKDIINSNEIFEGEKEQYLTKLRTEYETEGKKIIAKCETKGKEIITECETEGKKIVQKVIDENKAKMEELQKLADERDALASEVEKLDKQVKSQKTKTLKLKTEFEGIKNFIVMFPTLVNNAKIPVEIDKMLSGYDEESAMRSLVDLEYHAMHSKDLRKQINRVKKEIEKLLEKYKGRYTTKANQTIYQLMVIGLQAELQNILYTLSYAKHDEAINNASALIQKFLAITSKGNAAIAVTISKFLTELEPLFIEAVEIEYQYYVKREQEKEEQRLIREQIRQEAAEKKELEAQKKKLEAEESKYQIELERTNDLLCNETNPDVIAQLQQRI